MAEWPFLARCNRFGCGHSSDVHSFDDAQTVGVSDPGAKFRCRVCGPERCPTMVRSAENLAALEAESRG